MISKAAFANSLRNRAALRGSELMLLPLTRTTSLALMMPQLLAHTALTVIATVGILLAARYPGVVPQEFVSRRTESEPAGPKNIVELQQFRQTSSGHIRSDEGDGIATLTNLNPTVNTWYLLRVVWQNGSEVSYHLENPEPRARRLILNPDYALGIEILERTARFPCNLFGGRPTTFLDQAKASQSIYAPLCDSRLYLRNPVKGHRTSLETAAEFLRTQVWGGENVITLFHHLLADTHRETGKMQASSLGAENLEGLLAPLPAIIDSKYANRVITAGDLGLELERSESGGMRPGVWYSVKANPGVYVTVIEPGLIDATILGGKKENVSPLDNVENWALCYLVAFDLELFDVAYANGTDHPGVYWSRHIQAGTGNPNLPGPDGIGTISPLVATGLISPERGQRVVATFTGGFKREHGAFKFGEFASKNSGSHYGFVVEGVVLSKLQPGLATILVLNDGSLQMKTWNTEDDQNLRNVKYARQNGVPLVEFDEGSRSAVPGRWVNNWGAGNWSGSEDMRLRTIRSGAALQSDGRKRFLIYAVFSDATPSAMARVFQAYQCRYGMLLDLNALEHTYLALYRREGTQLVVDHLLDGMRQVEKIDSRGALPRFLGYPDNRDFFYIMRTGNEKEAR